MTLQHAATSPVFSLEQGAEAHSDAALALLYSLPSPQKPPSSAMVLLAEASADAETAAAEPEANADDAKAAAEPEASAAEKGDPTDLAYFPANVSKVHLKY